MGALTFHPSSSSHPLHNGGGDTVAVGDVVTPPLLNFPFKCYSTKQAKHPGFCVI